MRFGDGVGKRLVIGLLAANILSACEPQHYPADSGAAAASAVITPIDSATRHILAFLRGERPFDSTAFADTVALYVGKEAGGTHTRYKRADLRNPASWQVRSGLGTYSLVPPKTLTKMTTRAGAHLVCGERQLAQTFPQLARLPHVGVMLQPEVMESCLQTWGTTFVFDNDERPRLVAAVYDQWEW